LQLYEFVVAIMLVAPLAITLIVLTATFLVAGLRDLFEILARVRVPETPEYEPIPEGDVDEYIKELKKENDLKLEAS
jgi:hypothetical protein